jgi:hypothetical protein
MRSLVAAFGSRVLQRSLPASSCPSRSCRCSSFGSCPGSPEVASTQRAVSVRHLELHARAVPQILQLLRELACCHTCGAKLARSILVSATSPITQLVLDVVVFRAMLVWWVRGRACSGSADGALWRAIANPWQACARCPCAQPNPYVQKVTYVRRAAQLIQGTHVCKSSASFPPTARKPTEPSALSPSQPGQATGPHGSVVLC